MFTTLSKTPPQFFSQNKPPYLVELKYDGEDIIIVRMLNGEIYALNKYNRIYEDLPFFKNLPQKPFIVRAEMYADEGKSGSLYKLKKALKEGSTKVAIHDILYYQNTDLRAKPLKERKQILQSFPHAIQPLGEAQNQQQIQPLFQKAVEEGYEGVVVKPINSTYRDNAWLKLKKAETYEVQITARKIGKRSFKMEIDGKHVGDISSGITPHQAQILSTLPATHTDGEYEYFKPIPALVEAQEFIGEKMRHPRLIKFLPKEHGLQTAKPPLFNITTIL
jgi:ATP-dependent DNA ligase